MSRVNSTADKWQVDRNAIIIIVTIGKVFLTALVCIILEYNYYVY